MKTIESGGERGYDAGKKINGRKRSILVDTVGNLIEVIVHAADIQDRDGAIWMLSAKTLIGKASTFCPGAGWWNEPLPGWVAFAG